MSRAALGRLLLLVLGLAAVGWVLRELGAVPGTDWVDAHVRGQGVKGEAMFLLLGAVMVAAGLPRQAVAFLGGYAFGAALGSALALLAQAGGSGVSFLWARAVGRRWTEDKLAGRFGVRLRPLVDSMRLQPFGTALALRLFPVGNNLALNLLAGAVGIPAGPFLLGSMLGFLPQTIVFALLGKGVRVDGAVQVALSLLMLAASVGLGLWLMRRNRHI
ncbi:TVP38/TMEM64 family protein [Sabulicella rubraurantiaca]|uniref:TVP38/TMEM64 family protein n=1 Tax=Sabulicella rubraurantiaca TaxID=2811429 RepID=UPI001A979C04|nr:VTT domain-containing protein [Sabulicella rubraurantiaca]